MRFCASLLSRVKTFYAPASWIFFFQSLTNPTNSIDNTRTRSNQEANCNLHSGRASSAEQPCALGRIVIVIYRKAFFLCLFALLNLRMLAVCTLYVPCNLEIGDACNSAEHEEKRGQNNYDPCPEQACPWQSKIVPLIPYWHSLAFMRRIREKER